MMIDNMDFDDIRPYNQEEIPGAISRMKSHPNFKLALDYLFSKDEQEIILTDLGNAISSLDFQKALMHKAINRILEKSSEGLSLKNEKMLIENGPSVFVANHRDILLDSAILQVVLVDLGLETSEITFGSNLMVNDFVIDFGKTNRMYTVYREGSPREMLENSKRLSAYVHYTIQDKKLSSWIAQRKGRTKDGNDRTDTAVLKMLTIYDRKNPIAAIQELNILPIIISYEWEPCDLLKIREQYLRAKSAYQKQEGEDINSVLQGIIQKKGRVQLAIGEPVNGFVQRNMETLDKGKIYQKVSDFIDYQVFKNHALYPNNYWAFDQLNNKKEYADYYDLETENQMRARIQELFELVGEENKVLEEMFLRLYANPMINILAANDI